MGGSWLGESMIKVGGMINQKRKINTNHFILINYYWNCIYVTVFLIRKTAFIHVFLFIQLMCDSAQKEAINRTTSKVSLNTFIHICWFCTSLSVREETRDYIGNYSQITQITLDLFISIFARILGDDNYIIQKKVIIRRRIIKYISCSIKAFQTIVVRCLSNLYYEYLIRLCHGKCCQMIL